MSRAEPSAERGCLSPCRNYGGGRHGGSDPQEEDVASRGAGQLHLPVTGAVGLWMESEMTAWTELQ